MHVKQSYTGIMTTSQSIRKKVRSGKVVRFEPQDLALINEDPEIEASFEQVICMRFCEKIKGYNANLVEQFTLSFNGLYTTIAGITFRVTEETLSIVTKIPPRGEKWFKGMPLDILCYEDFIKPNYLNGKIGAGIPSQYLWEPFQKLLKVIGRYFTCEIRFYRVYPYHVRMLIHFTRKKPLNLPLFLHRSLERMVESIHAKADQLGKNLSHFSLIKLVVIEELRRLNKDWDLFLISTDIPRDPKGDIPLSARETTFCSAGTRREDVTRKGKEIEDSSSHQPTP
jgi:hypothetical protein